MCLQLIPILRAGLVLLENAPSVLPSSITHHVGYVRDEKTLEVRDNCSVW
jgi:uracil phosphoribosyltransferase